jgi:tetratricopeptide (TPR) repeat protein
MRRFKGYLILIILFGLLFNACSKPGHKIADEALSRGKYEEAIKYYKEILTERPSDAHARNNLGIAYIRLTRYDDAFKEFQKAIAIDPNYAKAHYNLGLVYYHKGLLDKEIEEYKKALAIDPEYEMAHVNLASAYLQKGEISLAEKEYTWVLTKRPENKKALYNLGVIYLNSGRRGEAISMFERYLKLESTGKSAEKAREFLNRLKARKKDKETQ